ncbi:MAG: ADP-ribosylglycohydrolase family protein [Bacteroidia bacterium]|jgi:ADP-ribosylglycohydrolase|nr:ADP-ribosylglycohydrolase family protein [Bacteroidia bacterium]
MHITNALLGVAVGDAVGVPAEFKSRDLLRKNPVTDMTGFGTYGLPAGTWSDDTSLTLCLAEALVHQPFTTTKLARLFVLWLKKNHWTPRGEVFDVGIATREAIERLDSGMAPEKAGGTTKDSNGNGGLMRILPLVFYIHNKPAAERFDITRRVCSLTHGHIRTAIACHYFLDFASGIINGEKPQEVYFRLQKELPPVFAQLALPEEEVRLFIRLLEGNIALLHEDDIQSSGYVLHSLEAAIWCLLTTTTYRDAVLKAVNLGHDTDTTGAITGGICGLYYGKEGIPPHWLDMLVRRNDIEHLAQILAETLGWQISL